MSELPPGAAVVSGAAMMAQRMMADCEVADALERVADAVRAGRAAEAADQWIVLSVMTGGEIGRQLDCVRAAVNTLDDLTGRPSERPWVFGQIDLGDGNWLTPKQAAAEAGVSVVTVRRWLKEKGIIGTQVGGRWYVNREMLQRARG